MWGPSPAITHEAGPGSGRRGGGSFPSFWSFVHCLNTVPHKHSATQTLETCNKRTEGLVVLYTIKGVPHQQQSVGFVLLPKKGCCATVSRPRARGTNAHTLAGLAAAGLAGTAWWPVCKQKQQQAGPQPTTQTRTRPKDKCMAGLMPFDCGGCAGAARSEGGAGGKETGPGTRNTHAP